MYGAILSKKKQTLYSSFILIYFVVNSYIVNKTLKCMGLSLQKLNISEQRPKVSEREDQGSLSQTHA